MPPSGSIHKFERLFRMAASLDIDKSDVDRYQDFINRKIYDLLLMGQAAAKANGHVVIEPQDLPITKGLQESMHAFRGIDAELGLTPAIDYITGRPPLDLPLADETDSRLPAVAGGLSYALAQSFRIIDPDLKNPHTEHWDKAFQLFDLLM